MKSIFRKREDIQSEEKEKTYRRTRKETSDLLLKISNFLTSKKTVQQAAKSLGLLSGKTIVMADENDMGYIMDFSIFEAKIGTQTAIQYFYDYGPELSAKEDQHLAYLLKSHISLFKIVGIDPNNYTADLKDLLNEDKIYTITDISLSSQPRQVGILLFTRLFTFDNMSMTGGAAMAFHPTHDAEIKKRLGLQQFTKRRKLNSAELYLFFCQLFRSIGIETRTEENY